MTKFKVGDVIMPIWVTEHIYKIYGTAKNFAYIIEALSNSYCSMRSLTDKRLTHITTKYLKRNYVKNLDLTIELEVKEWLND